MKTNTLKYAIGELIFHIIYWVFGVGLFWSLIMLCQEKFHYRSDWQEALILAIIPGFIWFVIGSILLWQDDKIAAGRKAISATISKWLHDKNKN